MKKLIVLLSVAAIGFASCKKDYTCTCVVSPGGYTSTITYTQTTKKIAKTKCINKSMTDTTGGVSTTYTETCTLK